jgi:hypothetical protein
MLLADPGRLLATGCALGGCTNSSAGYTASKPSQCRTANVPEHVSMSYLHPIQPLHLLCSGIYCPTFKDLALSCLVIRATLHPKRTVFSL